MCVSKHILFDYAIMRIPNPFGLIHIGKVLIITNGGSLFYFFFLILENILCFFFFFGQSGAQNNILRMIEF